jgi:hypothetical protein
MFFSCRFLVGMIFKQAATVRSGGPVEAEEGTVADSAKSTARKMRIDVDAGPAEGRPMKSADDLR